MEDINKDYRFKVDPVLTLMIADAYKLDIKAS